MSVTASGSMRWAVSSRALSKTSFISCCATSPEAVTPNSQSRVTPSVRPIPSVFCRLVLVVMCFQAIAHSPDGYDSVPPQLFTQTADINFDGVTFDFGPESEKWIHHLQTL